MTYDPLFQLMQTLTKAEKRNFRLYVTRHQTSEDLKFIQLFDILDKLKTFDEAYVLKKAPDIKKEQLSNLKAHLYKQLLASLRIIYKNKCADIEIREIVDYARILYSKSLHASAQRILERAKGLAEVNHENILLFEIIEFEKLIESRHITSAHEVRVNELAAESHKVMTRIVNAGKLSNLALQLNAQYLQKGHAKNDEEWQSIVDFISNEKKNLPPVSELAFFERVYLYQAESWAAYIGQRWKNYYRYTYRWVEMFENEPHMKANDTTLYLRGIYNVMNALFLTFDYSRHAQILDNTEKYIAKHSEILHDSTWITAHHLLLTARIDKHFLDGSFGEGTKMIPDIEKFIKGNLVSLDEHRILVFYYKIACLYFGTGNFDKCIDYLNKIIQWKAGTLRTDIQCFARMLHLIAHYEKGHYALLEYYTKSVYRFLLKHGDINAVTQEVLKFLRKALYTPQKELRPAFIELRNRLLEISENPYERRSFVYLDIICWLESKITNKSIETISKKNFLERELRNIRFAAS